MDQHVIENVAITYTLLCMIRKLWIFQQNPWLQARAFVLADPGEFKTGVLRCHGKVQKLLTWGSCQRTVNSVSRSALVCS